MGRREFANRLDRLLKGRDLDRLAKALQLKGKSAFSHYRKGTREPNLERFASLCRELGVSADELLGLERSAANHTSEQQAVRGTARIPLVSLPAKRLVFDRRGRMRTLTTMEEERFSVPQKWIDELGAGLRKPDRLYFVLVPPNGVVNSMPRTIAAGATLVVDSGPDGRGVRATDFVDGAIYLVRHNAALECRRVWHYSDESCSVLICASDNTSVAPLLIHLGAESWQEYLLGLVVMISSDLRPKKPAKVQKARPVA